MEGWYDAWKEAWKQRTYMAAKPQEEQLLTHSVTDWALERHLVTQASEFCSDVSLYTARHLDNVSST